LRTRFTEDERQALIAAMVLLGWSTSDDD